MEKPLALKMAPKSLTDILGQQHLVGPDKILSNLVANKRIFSMILYGNPGIGKTSIALALVNDLQCRYRFLNATIHNKKDFDVVVEEAKMYGGMVLIMDEIHRLNKDKQDLLLPCLESGLITLIGMTTSNPYYKINPAIRSRCQIFELLPLTPDDIYLGLKKAVESSYLEGIKIDDEVLYYIASKAKFDLRVGYNLLEVAYFSSEKHLVTKKLIDEINPIVTIGDKDENYHYNMLSGLQKSIRGSDVDASIYYLAELLSIEDLDSIDRRLSVIVYEDIGLANPSLGPKLKAAIDAAHLVGLPEARLCYVPIVIEMALSPKSNSAYLALDKAMNDVKLNSDHEVPSYLKSPFDGYLYPHDYKDSMVYQNYLPKKIKTHRYYQAKTTSNYENALKQRYENIKKYKDKLKEESNQS